MSLPDPRGFDARGIDPEITDYIARLSRLAAWTDDADEALRHACSDASRSAALAERLITAVQILRNDGAVDAEIAFMLIATFAEETQQAFSEIDDEFQAIDARVAAIERVHGLGEDDFWYLDEGPPEWHAANEEWSRVFDALPARFLERCGEQEMVRLLAADPKGYELRVGAGWARLTGEDFDDE